MTTTRGLDFSEAYRRRREELLLAERALRDQQEAVAALRRSLPPGPVRLAYTGHSDMGDDRWRGIDPYCATWAIYDLLPSGRGEWFPSLDYLDADCHRRDRHG